MTTIDHAAEALRIIHESTHDDIGTIPLDLLDGHELAEYHASMAEAQVHATLALVEQARIANVLTLHRYEHERGIAPDRSYLYEPDTDTLRDDIKKGLGL